MSKSKAEKMFDTARRLYWDQQESSGLVEPIPYVYARIGDELIIFSAFGKHSTAIMKALKESDL